MSTYDDILGGKTPLGGMSKPYIDVRTYAADTNDNMPIVGGSASEQPSQGVNPARGRSIRSTKVKTTEEQEGPVNVADEPGKKQLSYVELFQQMNPYKPPTPAEVEHERRKQRQRSIFAAISDGISAMANIYYTSRYSPNAWDANNSMSKKTRERWEKAQKEREANQRTYMDGYLRAMAMDDEKARNERNWRHTLKREEIADKRYEDEIAHRDKLEGIDKDRYDEGIRYRNARDKVKDDQWQKTFQENSAQNQQRMALETRRLSREIKQNDSVTFVLGLGKGTITIPKAALNDSNVSFVFSKLDPEIQKSVQGTAIKVKGRGGKEEIKYGPPTPEAMLSAIGANIEDSPEAQAALKEIAGHKQTVVAGRKYSNLANLGFGKKK